MAILSPAPPPTNQELRLWSLNKKASVCLASHFERKIKADR
jgi:hypothetical protein